MSGCVWYNVAMAKSHLVLALVAAVILPTEAALKGIVLWPHQARKYPDLSAAISLEYSYALPCDVVSGTNSTGALVCDWSKFCFGHCVLNVKQVPVRWYEIEQEIPSESLKTHHLTSMVA